MLRPSTTIEEVYKQVEMLLNNIGPAEGRYKSIDNGYLKNLFTVMDDKIYVNIAVIRKAIVIDPHAKALDLAIRLYVNENEETMTDAYKTIVRSEPVVEEVKTDSII